MFLVNLCCSCPSSVNQVELSTSSIPSRISKPGLDLLLTSCQLEIVYLALKFIFNPQLLHTFHDLFLSSISIFWLCQGDQTGDANSR